MRLILFGSVLLSMCCAKVYGLDNQSHYQKFLPWWRKGRGCYGLALMDALCVGMGTMGWGSRPNKGITMADLGHVLCLL